MKFLYRWYIFDTKNVQSNNYWCIVLEHQILSIASSNLVEHLGRRKSWRRRRPPDLISMLVMNILSSQREETQRNRMVDDRYGGTRFQRCCRWEEGMEGKHRSGSRTVTMRKRKKTMRKRKKWGGFLVWTKMERKWFYIS